MNISPQMIDFSYIQKAINPLINVLVHNYNTGIIMYL